MQQGGGIAARVWFGGEIASGGGNGGRAGEIGSSISSASLSLSARRLPSPLL